MGAAPDTNALDHAAEEPEIREQGVADPLAWRRVRAAGNADFALLNTEEANETGAVGAETLADERARGSVDPRALTPASRRR